LSATAIGAYDGRVGAAQVLLVDDDPLDLADLRGLLEEAGFGVSTAPNADAAIGVVHRTPVDVVITDVAMPGMSGLDLLRWVRATRPALPVIVMTSRPTADGEALALDLGAVAYLRKPVSVLLFLHAVARALMRSHDVVP
jgi:DNA-binding response OmpR family regulator